MSDDGSGKASKLDGKPSVSSELAEVGRKASPSADFRGPDGTIATEVARAELELVDKHGVAKGTAPALSVCYTHKEQMNATGPAVVQQLER